MSEMQSNNGQGRECSDKSSQGRFYPSTSNSKSRECASNCIRTKKIIKYGIKCISDYYSIIKDKKYSVWLFELSRKKILSERGIMINIALDGLTKVKPERQIIDKIHLGDCPDKEIAEKSADNTVKYAIKHNTFNWMELTEYFTKEYYKLKFESEVKNKKSES